MDATQNNPLVRLGAALALTGFSKDYWTKLVAADVVTPVYPVWRVRDKRRAILRETDEATARAEAERIGGTAEPVGRAWYRREQVLKLVRQN